MLNVIRDLNAVHAVPRCCDQAEFATGMAEGSSVGKTRQGPVCAKALLSVLRGCGFVSDAGQLLWCAGMVEWRPFEAVLKAIPQLRDIQNIDKES